jgi:hypothetical protein
MYESQRSQAIPPIIAFAAAVSIIVALRRGVFPFFCPLALHAKCTQDARRRPIQSMTCGMMTDINPLAMRSLTSLPCSPGG